MKLTAIIPATDAPATLEQCRSAIEAAGDPPEQIVTVTAAPTAGPAAARNVGARQATGDVLVFVDADVVVHRDAFSRIRTAFATDPGLSAIFGSYDDDPLDGSVVSNFRNLLHHHVHQSSAGAARTFWTGLGGVRRDAFEAIGRFAEPDRFGRPGMEDVDLGMRLVDNGGRVVLDPQLQGKHLKSWSLRKMVHTDIFARGVPWVRLLIRRRSAPLDLNLGWRHRLSAASAVGAAIFLLRGRPGRAAGSLGALVGLNTSFYALLWRRRGPLHALTGVLLHAVHHVCAVVALPLGVLTYVRRAGSRR